MFDLTSAANSTMAYDAVPLTLTPDPADHDAFKLRIEAKGLVWTFATDTEPRHANFVVMTTTFDKKGKILKEEAKIAEVKLRRRCHRKAGSNYRSLFRSKSHTTRRQSGCGWWCG